MAAGWRATRSALAADRTRLLAYFGAPEPLYLHAGYIAVALYRVAHYLHTNGWRRLAGAVRLTGVLLTGADLDPAASIGKGVIIPNPQAVTVQGTIGDNCTILAHASIGWPLQPDDLGAPVLGNDVVLEPGALVLGAITIGNRVRIGPRCLVMQNLADDAEVLPLAWRSSRR
jgi:serine O-acetyltransferase